MRRTGAIREYAAGTKESVPASGVDLSNAELFQRIQLLLEDRDGADDARLGRIDHVTRLPNRVQFLEDFSGLSAGSGRALVLVTLADAKHFNDLLRALGHAYSEDFVRAGAERLGALLPTGTAIYHVSVLSFVFVADDEANGEPPAIVSDIVADFRHSILCQDIPVDTRVGVGVTSLSERIASPSELLRATLAAAQDSRRSLDGWARYNRSSDEAHVRAFRLLTDMPVAFSASNQFALHFQPRINLSDRACVSAEALLRWTHPVLGPVSPGEFVPLAEATALITPLTEWVLSNALMAVNEWQRSYPGLRISINVSPKNLEEPGFIDALDGRVRKLGIDPALVELEFTEGVLATNWPLMLRQLGRLRDLGFDIAIDDFGSGYSNMSYLGKIPARYLKIDQSFVRPLGGDARNRILVRSIIEMAHALDYEVVAEGVETEEALDLLSAWNCDEGQGYFMSRPLDAHTFANWLAR